VEAIPGLIRAYNEDQWREAWTYTPKLSKLVRQIETGHRCSHRESLYRAAYFVAGRLYDEGFSLFQNGGQPLLKRQREAWTDEILFHSPNTGAPGFFSPVSVEIIVSLDSMRAVREKYCRSCAMVPAFVASANVGQFEIPPSKILWNLENEACYEEIATLVYESGLAWIEELSDPVGIEDKVIAHCLPNVDDTTGLEMVLALGGRNSAARVVRTWRQEPVVGARIDQHLHELSRTFGPVYRGEDSEQNLAVLCVCYDLLGPQRRR